MTTTSRFIASYSTIRDAKAAVASLTTKHGGPGRTYDWGTQIFVRHNRAPKTRPYVVFVRIAGGAA